MTGKPTRPIAAVLLGLFATFAAAPGNALTLYWAGGSTDIPDGTPISTDYAQLGGIWDTTTRNWAVDTNGTAYVAWTNGTDAVAWLSPFPTGDKTVSITQAVDVVLNRIVAPLSLGAGYNHNYQITATEPRTLTLAGEAPEVMVSSSSITRHLQFASNVRVVAANGFTKTGNGSARVFSDSPGVAGTVTVYGSAGTGIVIENTGKLTGVSEFDVQSGAGVRANLSSGANDRIGDGAIVRLRASGRLIASGNTGSTESFDRVVLATAGVFDLGAGSGTPRGQMILTHPTAGVDRGPDGVGVLYFNGNSSDNFQTDVVVQNGVATDSLLPWAATLRSRPVQLSGTTMAFEPLAVTAAPADVATWVAGSRYRIEGTAVPTGTLASLALDSLGIYNSSGGFTLTIGEGQTLTVSSGQISMSPNATNGTKTFDGGQLTSGSDALYILTGNSSAASALTVKSVISGDIDVVKGGSPYVYFSGTATNTYTGTTYVSHGRLHLNKTADQAAIPGDVVVCGGANLYIDAGAMHINTNASVIIREGGSVTHNNSGVQVYGGTVTFDGGLLSLGGVGEGATFCAPGFGVVFTNGGTVHQTYNGFTMGMRLLTNLRYDAVSTNQALWTTANQSAQTLALTTVDTGAATRTFDVDDGVGLDATKPEVVIDIPLYSADESPATLNKTGTGVLSLDRVAGRFVGGATVAEGTLLVNGPFLPRTIRSATTANGSTAMTGLATTNGLYYGQRITGPGIRTGTYISGLTGGTTLTLSQSADQSTTADRTFEAAGALGTGSVFVAASAKLGGTGGVAGDVTLAAGGIFDPGTPAAPQGSFSVGGGLDLAAGGVWHVDVADESSCDAVHVYGDIALGGSVDLSFLDDFLPATGEWTIATYDGTATGSMTAPAEFRVLVDDENGRILLRKSKGGMVILVR